MTAAGRLAEGRAAYRRAADLTTNPPAVAEYLVKLMRANDIRP